MYVGGSLTHCCQKKIIGYWLLGMFAAQLVPVVLIYSIGTSARVCVCVYTDAERLIGENIFLIFVCTFFVP